MGRKLGYGMYRGHNYKMLSRGKHHVSWSVADETGVRRTEWYSSISEAVAEFKAGVDDILTDEETSHD